MADRRRILVTGSSGFIGTNLVAALRSDSDWHVVGADSALPRDALNADCHKTLDIRDREAVMALVSEFEPSVIIHLAARTDLGGESASDYGANTEGVSNIVEASTAHAAVDRVIYASSRLVFRIGDSPANDWDYSGTTAYGLSKIEGERIVREADHGDVTWAIVRPTSIWGPWFGVPYRNFFDSVCAGRYLHPRGHTIRKSFGYVGNVVHQLLQLSQVDANRIAARPFFLADYEPLELFAWAQMISRELNARPIRSVPLPVLRCAGYAGDAIEKLTGRDAPLTSFRLNNLLTDMVYDLQSLRAVVGETPYSLAEGTHLTAQWMRD